MTGNNGFEEPLIVPPFNPFAKLKDGMPGYMWFKNMSPVIPNIDRLELDIQFQNLTQSVFYPRYMQSIGVGAQFKFIEVTALAADLKLYWYEVPVNMSIPRSVDLQTFNVREYQSAVALDNGGPGFTRTTSDLIQLNSTPTLIMIHIERDKDDPLYVARSASKSRDLGDNANPIAVVNAGVDNAGLTSWDAYGEITNIEILLGDRPNVISTNFTQRELYYLTQKNSKAPYPYSYNDWRSVTRPQMTDVDAQDPANYNGYASKCVVMLRPKDLAERIPDGVFAPNSFQVNVNGVARLGTHGYGDGGVNAVGWRLYIHLFFGKHFLRIEPDKAQFQEQSIPLDQARTLLNPVLEPQGVAGLGSGLQGIRLRSEADAGYQSRV